MQNFFQTVIKAIAVLMSTVLTFFTSVIKSISGGEKPEDPTSSVTEPVEDPADPSNPGSQGSTSGTFTITSYGWGHGVGMSQCGAIVMAEEGTDYINIVKHYYPGTKLYYDSKTPSTVKYGGKTYDLVEFLCRTTMQEIGDESPIDAIKAQAVAIYSFAKYYSYNVKSTQIAINTSFKYKGSDLYNAILELLSMESEDDEPRAQYVSPDGKNPALTIFGHSAAHHTTDAESVWGAYYSYLVPVSTPEEINGKTFTFSSAKMKNYIMSYSEDNDKDIHLSSDPADWLKILNHDKAFSDSIGYVTKMKIGDKEINGNTFHCYVVDYGILSHCFSLSYKAD